MSDENKLAKLQEIEHNLHRFLSQKQQFQTQLIEMEAALSEIEKTDQSHRIIGNIMVEVKPETLKSEISEKKEMVELRLKSIEKQEKSMREQAEEIQKELSKE